MRVSNLSFSGTVLEVIHDSNILKSLVIALNTNITPKGGEVLLIVTESPFISYIGECIYSSRLTEDIFSIATFISCLFAVVLTSMAMYTTSTGNRDQKNKLTNPKSYL
jgi:hypothetical protein